MATKHSLTSPETGKDEAAVKAAAATQGNATKYWLELISNPAGNNNRLWLMVNNTWSHLSNSTPAQEASVQNAFNAGSNLQVAVWFDASNNITGLVVKTP